MLVFLTLGFIISVSVSVSAQQCDAPPQDIRSMKPSFGGIDPFYSIAKGISDGLQSTPNSKTYNDLNSLIFGNGAVTYDQVIKDMVVNQIGAIVFWSFGFVFVLAALVLGIATCIWQCCYSCVPKGESDRSNVAGYVYASLLVVTFSFVLTGIVLFNIAETNLVDSVNDGLIYTREITTDLSSTLLNGTGQLTCEVGKTTNTTFEQINVLVKGYSDTVVNGTSQQVGLTAVNQFDYSGFKDQNEKTTNAGIDLSNEATKSNGDAQCTSDKQTLNAQGNVIAPALTGLSAAALGVQTDPNLVNINKNILDIKNGIQKQADQASNSISNSQNSINDAMDSITNMLNNVQSDINNVMNTLESGHRDITTSSAYTAIQITVRLLITIPACLGCVFMIVAFIAILQSLRKKEKMTQKLAPAVLSTFYTTIAFSIILLLLSSLAFVGGWFMSAMCVPIFEDPTYQLFHLMNQTVAPVANGTPTVVNIGDVLYSCGNTSTTMYTAINGTNIISANSISSQLNLDFFRNTANQEIQNQPKSSYPIPNQAELDTWQKALNDALDKSKAANLASCGNQDLSTKYNVYIENLQKSVDYSNAFMANLETLNKNAGSVNDIAEQQNNVQFDQGDASINQSVNALMSNLSTNIFKCSPLVDIYHNGGHVMCEQFGKPIQGLWASVGLAGIFLFVLAILLLLIFRWLKTGSDNKLSPSFEDENSKRRRSRSRSRSPSRSHSPSSRENRRLGKSKSYSDDDVFTKPVLHSASNTAGTGLPRIRPYEFSDQQTTPPYFSDVSSPNAYPRVQVLPDSRHPPMSPNYYDTEHSGPRLARFDDIDLFGEHSSNHGSTARGLRRY